MMPTKQGPKNKKGLEQRQLQSSQRQLGRTRNRLLNSGWSHPILVRLTLPHLASPDPSNGSVRQNLSLNAVVGRTLEQP